VIVVADTLWERLLDLLLKSQGPVERVGFVDGIVVGEVMVATTVVVPDATLAAGYYDVSAEQMSEAGKHLRRYRLQRLVQVHTHAGTWTGHSERDDRLAYSHDDGAVSVVVPFHARQRTPITDCGVHVCRHGSWHELSPAETAKLLRVVPGALNFRPVPDAATSESWLARWLRGLRFRR
jgi:hypothetical protein